MHLIKKISTVTLFVILIISFIGYRTGFFDDKSISNNSDFIASNFLNTPIDTLNLKKRLSIDYESFILIDTNKIKAHKVVYRTFSLNTRPHMLSSSKSMTLTDFLSLPWGAATKDSEIIKSLTDLKIIHVEVSSNGVFDMIRRDADLKEAIKLIKQKQLKKDLDVRYPIKSQEDTNYFWDRINNVVQVSYGGDELFMIKKDQAVDFLNWYENFNIKRITPIFSSSKSLIVPSDEKINRANQQQYKKDKQVLKNKVKEYLNI